MILGGVEVMGSIPIASTLYFFFKINIGGNFNLK
jgi:hypothetical protein